MNKYIKKYAEKHKNGIPQSVKALSLNIPRNLDRRIKYSDGLKEEIRKKYAIGGYTHQSLADEYKIDSRAVCRIINPISKEKHLEQAKKYKNKNLEKYRKTAKESAKKNYKFKKELIKNNNK